jgi:hypothetical protein
MMSVLPRRVLVTCIPSALLCVVALHQAYRVSREGLTPWKGGGFGMFSTIDSQAERFVRLSVTTAGGETLAVPIPAEYRRQIDRARLLPWAPATATLAADLLRQAWVRAESQSSGGSSSPARVRLATRGALPDGQPIGAAAMRIEIYTVSFDPTSHRLSTRLLRAVEARTP